MSRLPRETFGSLEEWHQHRMDELITTPGNTYVVIDFPRGERYAVHIDVLAQHYGNAGVSRADLGEDEDPYDVYQNRIEWARDNPDELLDWARDNLEWGDIAKSAARLESDVPPLSEQWDDAQLDVQKAKPFGNG